MDPKPSGRKGNPKKKDGKPQKNTILTMLAKWKAAPPRLAVQQNDEIIVNDLVQPSQSSSNMEGVVEGRQIGSVDLPADAQNEPPCTLPCGPSSSSAISISSPAQSSSYQKKRSAHSTYAWTPNLHQNLPSRSKYVFYGLSHNFSLDGPFIPLIFSLPTSILLITSILTYLTVSLKLCGHRFAWRRSLLSA